MEGMDELTITQLQKVMNWSYPTALKFATINGEMRDGKWYVPADVIQYQVDALAADADNAKARFNQAVFVTANGS